MGGKVSGAQVETPAPTMVKGSMGTATVVAGGLLVGSYRVTLVVSVSLEV
jgi:hypothetical protein